MLMKKNIKQSHP